MALKCGEGAFAEVENDVSEPLDELIGREGLQRLERLIMELPDGEKRGVD